MFFSNNFKENRKLLSLYTSDTSIFGKVRHENVWLQRLIKTKLFRVYSFIHKHPKDFIGRAVEIITDVYILWNFGVYQKLL